MLKACKNCSQSFEVTEEDLAFYVKISPVFKTTEGLSPQLQPQLQIPAPTFCPDCRQQRRLSFRNERNLYKRNCDLCKKDIVSIYSPDKNLTIYCSECYWGDKYDPLSYRKDLPAGRQGFDFEKRFFEQFTKLLKSIPKLAIVNRNSENSEYTNICERNKNCYLLVESSNNEDCLYSYWIQTSKDCVDCSFCDECTLCYECDNCDNCYNLKFSENCINTSDSYFLSDCISCKNCFGCVNLAQKEFYIFNEAYSKEDYFIKLNELLQNINSFKNHVSEHFTKFPKKYAKIINSENCNGDYISNSKDCINCFHANNAEYCKNSYHVWRNSKFILDCDTVGIDSELCYESINTAINSYNNIFCARCWTVKDSIYCNECDNSNNLFGCIGLNHKQYCILNKQYTKEEYKELVPKIIEHMLKSGEWGEFFPSSISPFGYNETVAQEYFPLSKEKAISKGFKWSDYEAEFPKVEKIIPANLLPDNISEIPDDILNWAIKCEITEKPFKIIKPELDFYRKMNLPIPRRHPDERHKNRMAQRNPRKLFDRKCMKCGAPIKTTYSEDRPEIVYCEKCYLEEVF